MRRCLERDTLARAASVSPAAVGADFALRLADIVFANTSRKLASVTHNAVEAGSARVVAGDLPHLVARGQVSAKTGNRRSRATTSPAMGHANVSCGTRNMWHTLQRVSRHAQHARAAQHAPAVIAMLDEGGRRAVWKRARKRPHAYLCLRTRHAPHPHS